MNVSSPWRLSLPAVFALTTLLAPARAGEERDETTPTAWSWSHSQTFAQLGSTVAQGWRIVDLEYEPGGTYTAAFVPNSGTYGRAWWYLIDVDAATLASFVGKNNARIIDLEARDSGKGTSLFAAVMVQNAGAEAKKWWYYTDTTLQKLTEAATNNNARLIDFEEYEIGGKPAWAGVMIANTGTDALKWWSYAGISGQALGSALGKNQARLYQLETSGANYNAIMVDNSPGTYWWYYVGISDQQVTDICAQNGARPIGIERQGNIFNVVMINNSNELTTRVGQILRTTTDGSTGVYLKESNGAVRASLNASRQFEPAGTLATLHHVHAMKQLGSTLNLLSTPVTVYTASTGSGCPMDSGPITEPLGSVVQQMMENSDNNRTQAVTTFFGQANLNATATALGMTGTSLNHRIGCDTDNPNRLTLQDAGRLHEAVINGYLGTWRSTFYLRMAGGPDSYGTKLTAVILQETQAAGLTPAQQAAFKARIKVAHKGGSYTFQAPTRVWRSLFGYVSIPFYTSAGIVPKEYVSGAFVDRASVAANADAALDSAAAEVLRDEIRAAAQNWKNYSPGSFTTFGHGCRGTNNIPPLHIPIYPPETPNIGTTATSVLYGSRLLAPVVLYIGFSRTSWAGNALPLDLGFLGMPGCTLDVAEDFLVGASTNALGQAFIPLGIPNDRSLIGGHFYTQFAVVDPGANAFGIVHSNALDTMVGGLR